MKRTRRTRRKKSEKTKTKEKFWRLLSLYIRTRDNYTCFTCGKHQIGKGMHAGHFINSKLCDHNLKLKYSEDNIYAQCFYCNINLQGNYVNFRERLIDKNGEVWVRKLEKSRHNIIKEFDYEKGIEKYKKKTKGMD